MVKRCPGVNCIGWLITLGSRRDFEVRAGAVEEADAGLAFEDVSAGP
jgi:hypothetical protein